MERSIYTYWLFVKMGCSSLLAFLRDFAVLYSLETWEFGAVLSSTRGDVTRDAATREARALLFMLLLCGGCTRAFVAAGPTGDVGTLGVSGLQGGLGGHLEVGVLHERERSAFGVALTGMVAGYSSAADADPVFFTTLEARSRSWLGESTRSVRPFLEIGGGAGVMWVAGPQAGGLVAHVATGLQGGGPGLQWWVALRERPAGLLGGQAEFFNSVQLALGLEVRKGLGR